MRGFYILVDREPIETDSLSWSKFFADMDNRRVAYTEVSEAVHVSTVFLGMDHAWGGGPPLLFETMVFNNDSGDECWRYHDWTAAERGHAMVVAALRAGTSLSEIDPPAAGTAEGPEQ